MPAGVPAGVPVSVNLPFSTDLFQLSRDLNIHLTSLFPKTQNTESVQNTKLHMLQKEI